MSNHTNLVIPENAKSANYPGDYKTSKARMLSEVIGIFALALGALWIFEWAPGFEAWQRDAFVHPILTTFFCIVLLPLLALWVKPNRDTAATIMNMNKVKRALKVGGKSFNVMMPVTFLSFPVVGALGYSFYGWAGGLIIAGVHLLAIPCLLLLFKNEDTLREAGFSAKDLLRILAVCIIAGILVFGLKFIHPNISGIITALVFIGFAEEFMFRGYIQGRLNQVFGEAHRIMNFSFGWGLIIAAFMFGLMHVLSPGNPFHPAWGLWTFVGGIGNGIIREKGGGFLASALVHGTIMIFPVFFGM